MRKCPKCAREVADGSKICRVCGSILDDVAVPVADQAAVSSETSDSAAALEDEPDVSLNNAESSASLEPVDAHEENRSITVEPWTCPSCGEYVEHDFEICWNCGTAVDGTPNADFISKQDAPDPQEPGPRQSRAMPAPRRCPVCGSDRIIPGATIADQGESSDGKLQAAVFGNPDALIFRDRMFGKITADICGGCGHLELRVENPTTLYEHYLRGVR